MCLMISINTKEIERRLKLRIEENSELSDEDKKDILGRLYVMLSENVYLKTIAPTE